MTAAFTRAFPPAHLRPGARALYRPQSQLAIGPRPAALAPRLSLPCARPWQGLPARVLRSAAALRVGRLPADGAYMPCLMLMSQVSAAHFSLIYYLLLVTVASCHVDLG